MASLKDIENVLDERVRPYLRTHGGEIESISFEHGIYRFRFLGPCCGCPSAHLTTEGIVAAELQGALPEIMQVVLIQETGEALLEQARSILNHHGG